MKKIVLMVLSLFLISSVCFAATIYYFWQCRNCGCFAITNSSYVPSDNYEGGCSRSYQGRHSWSFQGSREQ